MCRVIPVWTCWCGFQSLQATPPSAVHKVGSARVSAILCIELTSVVSPPTVMRVCREAASAGHRRVVIVSHREGIRDLAGRHQRLSTPYCCVSRFDYAESLGIPSLAFKDSRELVKWDTHHMHN